MNFRIGQKVVCVQIDDEVMNPALRMLALNKVYTVIGKATHPMGQPLLELGEVINPPLAQGWFAYRFRPLVSNGMETLNAILADPQASIKEKVDA